MTQLSSKEIISIINLMIGELKVEKSEVFRTIMKISDTKCLDSDYDRMVEMSELARVRFYQIEILKELLDRIKE